MVTVNPPWGDLDSSVVTLREGGRVLIQDSDAISPVLQVEMIPELVTSSRGLWAAGKGAPVTIFKTILPHVVGWDIMGYESEPPPSYNNPRNQSYSITLHYNIFSVYSSDACTTS